MTKSEMDDAKNIQRQINDVADQILEKLALQTDGDVYVAIAALAVAMCSLARADGMPIATVKEALSIANRQVKSAAKESVQ